MLTLPNSPHSPQGVQKYTVIVSIIPPSTPRDTNISLDTAPWAAVVILENITASQIQKGLFWTTDNIPLLQGTRLPTEELKALPGSTVGQLPFKCKTTRLWAVLEHADRPAAESNWHGCVAVFANEDRTLEEFSLGGLRRQWVCTAVILDEKEQEVFLRNGDSSQDVSQAPFDDEAFADLWWAWPMASLISEDPARQLVKAGGREGQTRSTRSGTDASAPRVNVALGVRGISSLLFSVGFALGILVLSVAAVRGVIVVRRNEELLEALLEMARGFLAA
ncbi:hypothetical protein B0T16DRAFT_396651 [Cercophora newfieldiana]|uniref:Uncharacterized protein n=1 Tax=Cercophora newfieldiana TaxID=92897 RepID=A0AA39YPC8_9PEZI|nr:hypothetical protein B0T16DRAFT_396651 [Cercophora newfieldiana]